MPASAVIPAPIVYTNIAAVKKLVVKAGPWLSGKAGGGSVGIRPGVSMPEAVRRGNLEVSFGNSCLGHCPLSTQ